MTATIHTLSRAAPARSAGVTGSPRPRAEIYTPWGLMPDTASAERAAAKAMAEDRAEIERLERYFPAQSYSPAKMRRMDQLLWALVIVAMGMSAAVLALLAIREGWL